MVKSIICITISKNHLDYIKNVRKQKVSTFICHLIDEDMNLKKSSLKKILSKIIIDINEKDD